MDPTDLPPPQDPQEPQEPQPAADGAMTAEAQLAAKPPRGKVAVMALAVIVALLAAGTVLVVRSGTKATKLDALVPSDAVLFASVQVRPSGDQRDALRALLNRLPADRRTKITDGIEEGLKDLFSEAGLDYAKDVKPWLGSEVAFALRPSAEGAPRKPMGVALLSVDDETAARAAFKKAEPKLEDATYLVADDVVYVAQEMSHIMALRAALEPKGPLTNVANYNTEVSKVGESLALVWMDGAALSKEAGAMGRSPFGGLPLGISAAGSEAQDVVGAAGFRATKEGFEVIGHSTSAVAPASKGGAPDLLGSVPAGILGSVTIFDLSAILDQAKDALSQFDAGATPIGLTDTSGDFPFGDDNPLAALGLDIEKDLQPWLGGEVSIVVGGITAPPVPDIGILVAPTDDAALTRTLTKLKKNLGSLGLSVEETEAGFDVNAGLTTVSVVRTADKLIIASSPTYAATLSKASSTSLAKDAVYQRTFGATDKGTVFQLYIRLDRVQSLLETFVPSDERAGYESDVKPILDEFQSLGIRATLNGNEGSFTMRLLVRE
jgi:hypothetical protein